VQAAEGGPLIDGVPATLDREHLDHSNVNTGIGPS